MKLLPWLNASLQSHEEIGYYDFLADMGVPYFHWGGMEATKRLADLCGIGPERNVLVVGCGTGFSACYIADNYGCRVVGIDIGSRMVARANERATRRGLEEKLNFFVADAQSLPFEDQTFDVVLTEFVSMFLDKKRIFGEYARILKDGGYLGINELHRTDTVPEGAKRFIEDAGEKFKQAVGLPLILPTPSEWKTWFHGAGLGEVRVEKIQTTYRLGEYVNAIGGVSGLAKMLARTLYHLLFNRTFRERAKKVNKLKQVLMRNKKTKPYVGALLCTGHK